MEVKINKNWESNSKLQLKMSSYANKYTLVAKHFSIKSSFAIKLRLIKIILAQNCVHNEKKKKFIAL